MKPAIKIPPPLLLTKITNSNNFSQQKPQKKTNKKQVNGCKQVPRFKPFKFTDISTIRGN